MEIQQTLRQRCRRKNALQFRRNEKNFTNLKSYQHVYSVSRRTVMLSERPPVYGWVKFLQMWCL